MSTIIGIPGAFEVKPRNKQPLYEGPNIANDILDFRLRLKNLEVKCENLEAENKQQAETILRLDRRLVAWETNKAIIYSGMESLQSRQNDFQRRLEALEERLAKPKDGVII